MKSLMRIGAILLIVALLLIWANVGLVAYVLLGITLILDIWIVIHKQDTISNWIHDLFGRKVDLAILGSIFAATLLLCGPDKFLFAALGGLAMHLFGHENI